MKRWQRRLFGILALGGGATGFAITLQSAVGQRNLLNLLLFFIVISIYAWGVWCGLLMLEGRDDAVKYNRRYWLLQAPVFSSPLVSAYIWGGANVTVVAGVWPLGMDWRGGIGASFNCQLLQPTEGLSIGVNIGALVLAVWLARFAEQGEVSPPAAESEGNIATPTE